MSPQSEFNPSRDRGFLEASFAILKNWHMEETVSLFCPLMGKVGLGFSLLAGVLLSVVYYPWLLFRTIKNYYSPFK